MYIFIKDSYSKARGGNSRVLDITCEHCDQHITYYQKDGPGTLQRMYADRMIDGAAADDSELKCPNCKRILASKYIYDKEQRAAYRLYVGAVNKKIVSKHNI